MKLTALSSGPLAPAALHALVSPLEGCDTPIGDVICVTNNWHDYGLGGLRICPDLDAAVQVLTSKPVTSSHTVHSALTKWGFTPGTEAGAVTDYAVAAGLARNLGAAKGWSVTRSTEEQLEADGGRAAVLPVSLDPVELHVIEDAGEAQRGLHVRHWLSDEAGSVPHAFAGAGLDQASPAPGVLEAIRDSDVVVLLPMSPVLDAGGLLGISGVRDALRGTSANVIVLSPAGLSGTRNPHKEALAQQQSGVGAASPDIASLYRDFADLLLIDEAEPAASYPRAIRVQRAPLVAALAGEGAAIGRLREAVRQPRP